MCRERALSSWRGRTPLPVAWQHSQSRLCHLAWQPVRATRSRWKIENEMFNTLKNQGYHFEHNLSHGQQPLPVNLAFRMMLAFLIDQVLPRCNDLFRATWRNAG